MIAFASSLDQVGPFTRDVADAALLLGAIAGHDPCDSTSLGLPEPVALAAAHRPARRAPRRARGAYGRGHRARRARRVRARRWTARASSAPTVEPCRLPHAPHGDRRLLPDRPRRGVARTSPATTASATGCGSRTRATCCTCTRDARPRASAPRSSAASCSAPTRCPRATTTPTTAGAEGAHADRAGLHGRLRAVRRHRHADEPRRRLRARREDRRPARHVPQRLLHGARCRSPGIPAISIPCGLSEGLPVGFQLAGPAFSENAPARRGPRARAGDRVRRRRSRASAGQHERRLGARHRAGDPRPARHAHEDVLRLRAVASASRPTRAPARSASGCPARCR